MHPYRARLIGAAVLLLLGSAALLGSPWMAKLLTQELITPDESTLSRQNVVMLWILLLFIQAILGYYSSIIITTTGQKILHDLRNQVFSHVQSLPLNYQQSTQRGDTISLLVNDATSVSNFISNTVVSALPQLTVCLGAIALLAYTHLAVGVIAVLAAICFVLVVKLFGRKIRSISSILVTQHAEIVSNLEENLQQLQLVKTYNRENHELAKFAEINKSYYFNFSHYLKHSLAIMPFVNMVGACLVLVLVALLISQFESNQLTVPDLISVLLYGLLLTRPISTLAGSYGTLQNTLAAAHRLQSVLEIKAEAKFDPDRPLVVSEGVIEFKNVSFSYPDSQPILQQASFTLSGKTCSAIVGPNGIGKSTLAKIILRFVEDYSGQVFIDGQSISDFPPPNVRACCAFVDQRPILISGTIWDNLKYGASNISDKDILNLLDRTNNTNWIQQLPNGFNTEVGERGMRLSGGQSQKIALCQALLTKPNILLLDEPTSMIDTTSAEWFENYRDELTNKTVIIITHDKRISDQTQNVFILKDKTLKAAKQN